MREAEPLDVAQQQGVAHRQRREHRGDQERRECARARRRACRHAWRASVTPPAAATGTTGAGRVVVTIRIALSSAPRASLAVGDTFGELHQSHADSQPWISAT